jgi:molybdopterin molybdotransferase
MLSVAEAQAVVRSRCKPLPPAMTSLEASLGLVLAVDVYADLDMPPYDKAMMDGFAIRCADLANGQGELRMAGEVLAGQTPSSTLGSGQAIRIMTGAPIPPGADAVVMIERTRSLPDDLIQIDDAGMKPGKNILERGREMRSGEKVMPAGTEIRPQEIGLLATVGAAKVSAYPKPTVAVVSTGDELVEAPAQPGPGKIRNSNGPLLAAQVERAGTTARYLGIARDEIESLTALISDGMASEILVLSGGVSAGKRDLVPGVLAELGALPHFHKVAMKPGKPVFFGSRDDKLIFGLPGNPVSAFVCFELFVRPAIRALAGHTAVAPHTVDGELVEAFMHSSDRPTYHPVWLDAAAAGWTVRPVPWFGSPDLRALSRANALALLPAGEHHFAVGERISVLQIED